MEILQDNVLARYLFDKYSANPKNWKFIISASSSTGDFFDATVSNPEEAWQLKIDSIYKPSPLVLGAKLDIDSAKLDNRIAYSSIPFGYRKLDSPIIMNILERLADQDDSSSQRPIKDPVFRGMNNINSVLGSLETVRPEKGKSYAYGPLVFTARNPVSSDNYQKEVADRLASRLRDSLRRRYSSYG
jgi:hypothetical protein